MSIASPPLLGAAAQPAWFESVVAWSATGIEAAGIGVLVIGLLVATWRFVERTRRRLPFQETYERYRADLGRAILLGLEFLVAADIIATVVVDPTLESVAVLAVIVLVRTFLSFSLEAEIEGRWPWQAREKESRAAEQ